MFPSVNTVTQRNALQSFYVTHSKTSLADGLEGKYGLALLRDLRMQVEVGIKRPSYNVTGWHHINSVFCHIGYIITLTLTVPELHSVCKRTEAKNGLFTLPLTQWSQQLCGHQINILSSVNLYKCVQLTSIHSYLLWFSELIQKDSTNSNSCPWVFLNGSL